MSKSKPSRGDIWLVDLNPPRGHEQAGKRPGFIISVDQFNRGPAGLVVVLPVTTKEKGIPFHVEIKPPEGGVKKRSFIKCEDIRSVSIDRLLKYVGAVSDQVFEDVDDRLRILLSL